MLSKYLEALNKKFTICDKKRAINFHAKSITLTFKCYKTKFKKKTREKIEAMANNKIKTTKMKQDF